MPFIGNQPAEAYSSFQKQDFTTSATTSYTLDHPVANENEIALFINFVRQEPTAAYTASGTSLTLTSATTSSDDMYCVYLGKAVQTVNPPNGSVGTAQLADSSVTSAKLASGAGGKILQVVQGTDNSATTNTTTTYADTGLSATITPSSTSSKIYIQFSQKFMLATGTSDRGAVKFKVLRDSTNIWEDTNFYAQTTSISSEIERYFALNYLDTPNTTSAITYKSQFALDSTATNKYTRSEAGSVVATLTLMEVSS